MGTESIPLSQHDISKFFYFCLPPTAACAMRQLLRNVYIK